MAEDKCPTCDGTGQAPGAAMTGQNDLPEDNPCPTCHGAGSVPGKGQDPPGGVDASGSYGNEGS